MKRSELFYMAIACVIDDKDYAVETKIEVLEMLFEQRSVAMFVEEQEKDKYEKEGAK